jgi:hypothetical protein
MVAGPCQDKFNAITRQARRGKGDRCQITIADGKATVNDGWCGQGKADEVTVEDKTVTHSARRWGEMATSDVGWSQYSEITVNVASHSISLSIFQFFKYLYDINI